MICADSVTSCVGADITLIPHHRVQALISQWELHYIGPRYGQDTLTHTCPSQGTKRESCQSRVSHFYRHLASPSLPRDIRKSKISSLLHIQWTIELLYKDNMSIVFCEMRRTMGVSGEMAGPVSRVLATMSQYSGWGDHRYQWGHVMPEYCHTSPVIQRQDHTYMHTTAHTHNLDNPWWVFMWRYLFKKIKLFLKEFN